MPTPASRPPLSVETTIRAIHPRDDHRYVLALVADFLDTCDPDERPAIQLTRWPKPVYDEHLAAAIAQQS